MRAPDILAVPVLSLPMSIAVSAVIHPSRLLRLALAAFALASGGAGLAALWQGQRFYFSGLIGLACMAAAALGVRAAVRLPNARVLDISGLGDMQLSVQQSRGAASGDQPWQLMPGSTLWPWLLVLLLRRTPQPGEQAGPASVLIILPDCVAPEQFRRIAVAARTIARRDNKFFENNKIF